ncbi:MAG: hypothetical protein HYV09_19305 [Deltaproteobacteria bacterium]|nr:hypothetical protein [Deltaproteobacteria bacterium]
MDDDREDAQPTSGRRRTVVEIDDDGTALLMVGDQPVLACPSLAQLFARCGLLEQGELELVDRSDD